MTVTTYTQDGLMNVVANLTPERSKTVGGGVYSAPVISDAELINAYRSSFLPRRIVDTLAEDATRRWRRINAEKSVIETIEREERRLRLQQCTEVALQTSRLIGGAAIYISIEGQHPTTPLDKEKVRRGQVRKLAVFPQTALRRGELIENVDSPWFGQPSYYTLTSRTGQSTLIHPSRLAVFLGAPFPQTDLVPVQDDRWADSVLTHMFDAFKIVDTTMLGMSDLVLEAKVDVVNIKGLMARLATDPAYEATLIKRFLLAARNKGINGMMVLDENETYHQKSQTFGGLPELIDRFFQYVSGACGIPVTRLFGTSPGGMNATGEADIRHYYDRVQTLQNNMIGPTLADIDECIERSATGTFREEVYRTWNSLWQASEEDKAKTAESYANVAEKMVSNGMMTPEAMGEALVNTLVESETMPGIEAAYRKMGPLDPDEAEDPDEDTPAAEPETPEQRRAKLRVVGQDAASPLYVRRDVTNRADIVRWARSQGIESIVEDLHVTVLYSRQAVDWFEMGEAWDETVTISAGGARQIEVFGEGALVLRFASDSLQWRHRSMVERGASHDYEEYAPHVTITYEAEGTDPTTIQPYTGRIELGPEIFEPIDENWKSKVLEAAE